MAPPNLAWTQLVADFYEEAGRRLAVAWDYYYADYARLIAASPVTRSLIAESIARSYDVSRDHLIVSPSGQMGLDFTFDDVTECVGPRYRRLPNPEWTAATMPPLKRVALGDHHDPPDSGAHDELGIENVKVRVEGGLLSVTLVGLRDSLRTAPKKRKPRGRAARPAGARSPVKEYHLYFDGDHEPVTLRTSSLSSREDR
jgi:hypothetical protein